jgi:hypothetical protein
MAAATHDLWEDQRGHDPVGSPVSDEPTGFRWTAEP